MLFITEYSAESSALKKHQPMHEVKAISESAKNAVRALKKLEARCQAGISYRDYAPALGDATFEVNMFIETDDSKKLENLTASIKKTLLHYVNANILWELRFSMKHEIYDIYSDFTSSFFQLYPEANKSVEEGGIISKLDDYPNGAVYFPIAISYVFSEASKELANSFALLNNKKL